ncbi:MAG: hypothetical protein EBU35_13680 [Marivivens sp.]|nr:hypothetical protein [Marivivens sp.]
MAAAPAVAGAYVNVETSSKFAGTDYSKSATDFFVGYEDEIGALDYFIEGGPSVTTPIRQIPTPKPPVIRPVEFARPVINVPGCTAVHPDAALNPSLLKDDPSRVGYACPEGSLPSINAMDYRPSELTILAPQGKPKQDKEKQPETPKPQVPAIPQLPVQQQTQPPAKPAQSLPQQIVEALPTAPAVVNTASIALVATTSALLAKPSSRTTSGAKR